MSRRTPEREAAKKARRRRARYPHPWRVILRHARRGLPLAALPNLAAHLGREASDLEAWLVTLDDDTGQVEIVDGVIRLTAFGARQHARMLAEGGRIPGPVGGPNPPRTGGPKPGGPNLPARPEERAQGSANAGPTEPGRGKRARPARLLDSPVGCRAPGRGAACEGRSSSGRRRPKRIKGTLSILSLDVAALARRTLAPAQPGAGLFPFSVTLTIAGDARREARLRVAAAELVDLLEVSGGRAVLVLDRSPSEREHMHGVVVAPGSEWLRDAWGELSGGSGARVKPVTGWAQYAAGRGRRSRVETQATQVLGYAFEDKPERVGPTIDPDRDVIATTHHDAYWREPPDRRRAA